jgi:FkbM family methyltransferase
MGLTIFRRMIRKILHMGSAPRSHEVDLARLIALIPVFSANQAANSGKTIFDLGMHVGQDTAFYLAKGFRVIAIEANPVLAQDGERNFKKQIDAGQLTILNIGVGDKEGVFPFYVNHHSEWSSFDKDIGSRDGCKELVDIPMFPFEKILARYGTPYFMKVDIEGYDNVVLQRLALTASRPQYLSVENGWPDMLDPLVALGYTGFKFINQAKVQDMRCPMPAREGRDIAWDFPWSSSGPFGEDTPGEWKTAEGILLDIKAYWENPVRDANIHGWYDLHAKLEQEI